MEKKELLKLSDEELLQKAKKLKSFSFVNALLIGVCIGIIIWSVVVSSWGFLTLIPLFFIYKMVNNSKKYKDLEEVLKEKNLK